MKKATSILIFTTLIFFSLFISTPLNAQYYNRTDYYSITKFATVYSGEFQIGKNSISQFFKTHSSEILKQEYENRTYKVEFVISNKMINSVDSLISILGYTTSSNQTNNNIQVKIKNLETEIADHRRKIEKEKKKQAQDTSKASRRYSDQLMDNTEETILRLTREIMQLQENKELAHVTLNLYDELSTPSNSKIAFAKMPGISYSILQIENPKNGISAAAYSGFNMKYIFTKGKSYFQIGVMKTNNKFGKPLANDSLSSRSINEFFTMEFGQDFYTRYFGRGNRKFFNLYSGYSIGGTIINRVNDENTRFVPFTNLSMGIELLKTKHVLFDVRGSYFLPLADINRNTRGVLLNTSFNFVF